MSRIGINGAAGRMGRAVMGMLLARGHSIAFAFDAPSTPVIGTDAGALVNRGPMGVTVSAIDGSALAGADGIIDFSSPAASELALAAARAHSVPIVVGTTGLSDAGMRLIDDAARDIPVLFSPNMAMGVNLLFKLAETAARVLGPGFDVEIVEAHHRMKKDAPSGTAKRLVEVIKNASPALANAPEISGREGITGERSDAEIGVLAMRGGSIVGDHTVHFIGMEERIELTHRAVSRDVLARGAVIAMEFLIGKKPGRYGMYDVLGL